MIVRYLIILLLQFCVFPVFAAETEAGASLGAKISEIPHWFKESFLDFEEDVDEAAAAGKRVMIYFHQEGCPYCAKLVDATGRKPGRSIRVVGRERHPRAALRLGQHLRLLIDNLMEIGLEHVPSLHRVTDRRVYFCGRFIAQRDGLTD